MNMDETFDKGQFSCFVAPILCRDLVDAGMSRAVPFQWRIVNKMAILDTRVFDRDGYYKDAEGLINAISPNTILTLPAYSLKDVEKPLHNYMLTCNEDFDYELSLDKIYDLQSCKARRMPDVFALLLLAAIRKHVVEIEKINSIINSK